MFALVFFLFFSFLFVRLRHFTLLLSVVDTKLVIFHIFVCFRLILCFSVSCLFDENFEPELDPILHYTILHYTTVFMLPCVFVFLRRTYLRPSVRRYFYLPYFRAHGEGRARFSRSKLLVCVMTLSSVVPGSSIDFFHHRISPSVRPVFGRQESFSSHVREVEHRHNAIKLHFAEVLVVFNSPN